MQMTLDFFKECAEPIQKPTADPVATVKTNLQEYIKVCGLVAYKDFYMKIKNGHTAIPAGINQAQYLALAKEVYENRSVKVNKQASRALFFAIKNKKIK
jgi:hypothetical protein